ncbi:MAG: amidohydrolase [Chloroflexi bacterium]|nr:amidohydrolase [Chloroflexota bacterium]
MASGAIITGTEARTVAFAAVDRATRDLVGTAKLIYAEPEVGFRERKTSALIARSLRGLGLTVEEGIAHTGLKAVYDFGTPGPRVAVICEMDSLRVPSHPGADPETGAAHACGHHTQAGMLLGVATALTQPELRGVLSGSVAFIATPAEEFIDVSARLEMRRAGLLQFLSGKQEMMRLGTFDDVDMAMMMHTAAGDGSPRITVGGTSNAHIVHHVRFIGRSSHAGGAPEKGINALQAAMLALNAINAQRDTLQERHVVRIHGIITKGGSAVNAVPDDVVYEGRVRAMVPEALADVNEKVLRCYRAGALAVGADVEITSIPGYLSLVNNPDLQSAFARNAETVVGHENLRTTDDAESRGGSTDMGDLSTVMPAIHPYTSAATGTGHGPDYLIADYDLAVVAPAKIMSGTVIDLLSNDAAEARRVLANYRPLMSLPEYLATQADRFSTELYKGR